jgi:hypothetical protein
MECPGLFGAFHIISLLIVVALTAAAIYYFKNKSEKAISRLALVVWIIVVLFEVYKQIVFTFEYVDGSIVGEYSWYIFPFQFCSTPIYVLPLVAFLKEGRVRDSAIFFLASYGLFAGLAVMIYPGDVYIETIGVNIQTMVHHGSQVVLGILFAVKYMRQDTLKRILSATVTFIVAISIAMIFNLTLYPALISSGVDTSFNMFYISPYLECTLPVLSSIYPLVPYPVFLFIYIVGFALAAWIVVSIVRGISHLAERCYDKRKIEAK